MAMLPWCTKMLVHLLLSPTGGILIYIYLYPGTWRTQRCAPGRSRWLPCQGTDSSRLRGCRLCNSDVVAEVVFVDFIVVIVVLVTSSNFKMNHAIGHTFCLQNTRQPMKIKKKKTSGYAIFCRCHRTLFSTSRIVFCFAIR